MQRVRLTSSRLELGACSPVGAPTSFKRNVELLRGEGNGQLAPLTSLRLHPP